jgi:hypothetical protein
MNFISKNTKIREKKSFKGGGTSKYCFNPRSLEYFIQSICKELEE